MIENLFVLVEEPSAIPVVRRVVELLLPNIEPDIYEYNGKEDLLRKLPNRMRGFAAYLPENSLIIVLIDRDQDDCKKLKERLEAVALNAGLRTKSSVRNSNRYNLANRIAVEELEAWFFGDWDAVKEAFPRVSSSVPNKAKYRIPDSIPDTWRALERLLQSVGYFDGGLRKIELAEKVSRFMLLERNTSRSFNNFCEAIEKAK